MASIPGGGGGSYDVKSSSSAQTGPTSINIGGFNVPAYTSKAERYAMYGGIALVALVAIVAFMPSKKKRRG